MVWCDCKCHKLGQIACVDCIGNHLREWKGHIPCYMDSDRMTKI